MLQPGVCYVHKIFGKQELDEWEGRGEGRGGVVILHDAHGGFFWVW